MTYRLPRNTSVKAPDSYNEAMDCTVRAVANATQIKYERIHSWMKCHGRKNRKGFAIQTLLRDYRTNIFGVYQFKEITLVNKMWIERGPKITVRKFLEKFAELDKAYICIVTKHAFAIRDGYVWDDWCGSESTTKTSF